MHLQKIVCMIISTAKYTSSQLSVRKAYKRMALRTHPDKLPKGSSAEDRRRAEEKFKKVWETSALVLQNAESI